MWIQSFSFPQDCHSTKITETNLPIARRRIVGFMLFLRVFIWNANNLVLNWTRVATSISNKDSSYTMNIYNQT